MFHNTLIIDEERNEPTNPKWGRARNLSVCTHALHILFWSVVCFFPPYRHQLFYYFYKKHLFYFVWFVLSTFFLFGLIAYIYSSVVSRFFFFFAVCSFCVSCPRSLDYKSMYILVLSVNCFLLFPSFRPLFLFLFLFCFGLFIVHINIIVFHIPT